MCVMVFCLSVVLFDRLFVWILGTKLPYVALLLVWLYVTYVQNDTVCLFKLEKGFQKKKQ